jgi:hypothetical protein
MTTAQTASDVKRFLKEKIHDEFVPALEQLVDELPDELIDFSDAERLLRERFLTLAGRMLQNWSTVAFRQIGIPNCASCGKRMRHKGLKRCTLTTTLGDITVYRPRYRCESCRLDLYPHDQYLRFLSNGVSLALGKVVCRMGADRPFGRAAEDLLEDYKVRLCKQTIENVTEAAGKSICRVEDQHREAVRNCPPEKRPSALPVPTDAPGEIAMACCDGVMIHTKRKPDYLKNKADQPGWYEVRAASIAIGNRTPGKSKPEENQPDGHGYRFRMNVLRTSSFARFESVEDVGMDMYLRACEMGFFEAAVQCFVSDGAGWLRNIAEEYFPDAILILDWYHVSEYLSDLASQLFGQGTAQAKRWLEYREAELWDGRVQAVLQAIDRQRQKDDWSQKQQEALDRTYGYLDGNRDRMNYPRYRELGLPIGSGRAEGLCKTLVEGRCKQSGMRNWEPTGAEGVLRLRAARHDGVFNETWEKHFAPAD